MKKLSIFGGGVFATVIMLTTIPSLVSCRQPSSVQPPSVTGITVTMITETPLSRETADTVQRGETARFTAVVEGTRQPPQTVNWYIADGGRNGGTRISSGGVLRVDSTESLDSLTIGARSTFDTRQFGYFTIYLEGEIISRLPRPQIELEGSLVSWNEIQGAGGYSLRVDGIERARIGYAVTSFDLAELDLPPGTYSVSLVALGVQGESLDSLASETVFFRIIFDGEFTINPPDFPPLGGDIPVDIPGPEFGLLDGPITIRVERPWEFDPGSIAWYFDGVRIGDDHAYGSFVSGPFGEILSLGSRVHGELLGPGVHFLTVKVTLNGQLRARRVSFTVTM